MYQRVISGIHEQKHTRTQQQQQTMMSSPVPSSLCRAICCYSSGPGLGLRVREGGGGTGRWQEGGTSGQADLFSDFQNHCFMATCSYTSQIIFLSLGAFPVQQGLITSAECLARIPGHL